MAKEKKTLFEEMEFTDANIAKETLDKCEEKLSRNKIGVIVALLVPVLDIAIPTILMALGAAEDVGFTIWIIVALAAYLIGGGLLPALKLVWRVTWFAFVIIPIFPIDFLIGAVAFCISGAIALFLPIIFVLMTKHQITMDRDAAKAYLAQFAMPNSETAENYSEPVYESSYLEK